MKRTENREVKEYPRADSRKVRIACFVLFTCLILNTGFGQVDWHFTPQIEGLLVEKELNGGWAYLGVIEEENGLEVLTGVRAERLIGVLEVDQPLWSIWVEGELVYEQLFSTDRQLLFDYRAAQIESRSCMGDS